jgi:lipopolysaccharide export system protein LptA
MKQLIKSFLWVALLGLLPVAGWAQTTAQKNKIFVDGTQLEYTTTNRVSVIQGSPVVVKDPAAGMQLTCDVLRVHWSTNNSGIDMAYADGSVVITLVDKDGNHKATGKLAVYDGKTDVITLTGEPYLESIAEKEGRKLIMRNADKVVYDRVKGKFVALGKYNVELEFPKSDAAAKPAGAGATK